MPTSQSSVPPLDLLLEKACEHHECIELTLREDDDERDWVPMPIAGFDERHIYLDRDEADAWDACGPGLVVRCYLLLNDVRYAFETHVAHGDARDASRPDLPGTGLVLLRPDVVRAEQRRRFFRVSLVGADPIAVVMRRLAHTGEGGAASISETFNGILVNLSLGGAAIRIEGAPAREMCLDDRVPLRFDLPGEGEALTFLGRVRRVRPLDDRGASCIGVTFLPWPSEVELRLSQEPLQRYITRVQRRRLRRAK